MSDYEKTAKITVRRQASRGFYDAETINAILDEGYLCHVGFLHEGQPFVIPTLYARIGEKIYIHGSSVSRMLKELNTGLDLCLTVTLVDGIVLARSAFHHSMNYRSVVVFGTGRLVMETELKLKALKAVSENVMPERWDDARAPTDVELNATSVIEIPITEASAKIRKGDPKDDSGDYDLPIWAGVLPIETAYGVPEPDSLLGDGIDLPEYLKRFTK